MATYQDSNLPICAREECRMVQPLSPDLFSIQVNLNCKDLIHYFKYYKKILCTVDLYNKLT